MKELKEKIKEFKKRFIDELAKCDDEDTEHTRVLKAYENANVENVQYIGKMLDVTDEGVVFTNIRVNEKVGYTNE